MLIKSACLLAHNVRIISFNVLARQFMEDILIFVKATDLTISLSVWLMFRPSSQHRRCGTTPSVVSTRAPLETRPRSPCSVPATPVLIAYTTPVSCVLYLQCTSDMSAYRYLVVHFLISGANEAANFCELEVYIRRKFLHRRDTHNSFVINWQLEVHSLERIIYSASEYYYYHEIVHRVYKNNKNKKLKRSKCPNNMFHVAVLNWYTILKSSPKSRCFI